MYHLSAMFMFVCEPPLRARSIDTEKAKVVCIKWTKRAETIRILNQWRGLPPPSYNLLFFITLPIGRKVTSLYF